MRFSKLALIFAAGLLLRLSLMFLDFGWDVNNHIAWAADLYRHGFRGFYETQSTNVFASLFPNYPPVAMYLFYLSYPLKTVFYNIFWWINITIPLFPSKIMFFFSERAFLAGVMKIPAILSDLGLAAICFAFIKKMRPANKKLQIAAASFILFNPAFFYNSAYWGQIDSIAPLFVLISFYLLFFTDWGEAGATSFTLALLVKPTALVYVPVFVVLFFRKFGIWRFFGAFAVANLIFWAAFFPFYKEGNFFLFPYTTYFSKVLEAQSLPFVTNGAFNFWVPITQFEGIKDTGAFVFGLSYRFWGYFIAGFITISTLYVLSMAKKKTYIESAMYSSFFLAFAFFLFLTKMHERYLMLPLPFLLVAALNNKRLIKWFVFLSFMSFLNLYHSWPVPRVDFVLKTLTNPIINNVLSLSLVFSFLYLFRLYVKSRGLIK